MYVEHHEPSHTVFSKPTSTKDVCALGIGLITHPGVDVARLPLRVVCSLRLVENHEGAGRIRIDYFVAALWAPDGGEPRWNDITRRELRPEDDEAARRLFSETEEEGFRIDAAIEQLLGVADPRLAHVPPSPDAAGGAS